MLSGLSGRRSTVDPFSLDPGAEAAKAVWNGMAEYQPAWPFIKLEPDNLGEFIERWVGWFGAAASGQLSHPSSMPERAPQNSWRQSLSGRPLGFDREVGPNDTRGARTGDWPIAFDRTTRSAACPRLA